MSEPSMLTVGEIGDSHGPGLVAKSDAEVAPLLEDRLAVLDQVT